MNQEGLPLFILTYVIMREKDSVVSDKLLLAAIRAGSENAFRQLYEKYWEDLYRMAYRRLASPEDIKDILQDVFLSLWNNINEVNADESLGGYLYTSLRNRIFNFFEKRQNRLNCLMKQPFNPVESEEIIWNRFNTKEIQKIIAFQVAAMPPKMKRIYLLSKKEQLTISEIAELLNLSPQTVKNQLHRALERMRQNLQKHDLHILLIAVSFISFFRKYF